MAYTHTTSLRPYNSKQQCFAAGASRDVIYLLSRWYLIVSLSAVLALYCGNHGDFVRTRSTSVTDTASRATAVARVTHTLVKEV